MRLIHAAPMVMGFVLAACGGGGSTGSPQNPAPAQGRGFTVSADLINHAASVGGAEPTSTTLDVTITDAVRGQYGIRVTHTENAVNGVSGSLSAPATTRLYIGFDEPTQLPAGVYRDTLRVGLCATPLCDTFANNPVEIPVTYTVTVGRMPTVTLSAGTADFSAVSWDPREQEGVRLRLTVVGQTRFWPAVTTTHTTSAVRAVSFGFVDHSTGNVDISVVRPTERAPGTYTDTVTVRACIDAACNYPLTVTPSTVQVTYTISATLPGPQGYTLRRSALPAADLATNASGTVVYAAIPASSPTHAASVVDLDPVADSVRSSIAAGFDPAVLGLSDDASMLYVGERAGDSVQRFTTAPLTPDLLISLGSHVTPFSSTEMYANDLRVAPGQPRTVAVRRYVDTPNPRGHGVVIFDDAVVRPVGAESTAQDYGYLAWYPDGTRLYTNDVILTVDATGAVFNSHIQRSTGRVRLHDGFVYSDRNQIVDPANAQVFARFPTEFSAPTFAMLLDVPANRAYLATKDSFYGNVEIEVFNLATRARLGGALLPTVAQNVQPTRIVRYGTDGLAIVNSANELYLLNGAFVSGP